MVRKNRNNISVNRKVVKVIYLDGSEAKIDTEADLTLKDVFEKACHSMGISDTNLLGLATFTDDSQPRFLDLDAKIVKHCSKSWRTLNQGLDSNGEPVFAVHLLVQYYVDKFSSIRDKQARDYYYQQLRRNFIDYPIMYPDDRCFLLAAYSMIAEEHDDRDTFDPREFFPAWVVDKHKSEFIKEHLPSLLYDFASLTKTEAQTLFATALCHETPIGYNMHLYRVSREPGSRLHPASKHCGSKHCVERSTGECLQCSALYFGVGPRGVEIFEVGAGGFIQSLSQFKWNQIENINYTRRKLELVGQGMTTTMYCASEELPKQMLGMCQRCHAMYLSQENSKLRRSANKSFRAKYRESYIHSENLEMDWRNEGEESDILSASGSSNQTTSEQYKKDRQNRYSIISDAASSSTSGIVSDRTCFSYYDSQEELLSGSKTITSSQDSLLEPSESCKSRPVQRATSEPSKKFEQLRELKVRQHHPPLMSRAASDDTVRSSQKVADHIYENISEVRNRLQLAAQAKLSKLSPRVSVEPVFPVTKPQLAYSKYRLQGPCHGALHYSMGQLNQLSSMHSQAAFRSQQSMVKPSASMEQLLKDYQPPPSYNERHKKVREQMLAAMSQEELTHHEPSSHRKASSDDGDWPSQITEKVSECTCRTTSYPEIDKLKNMSGLPMISALFSDKNLQQPGSRCHHCNNNNNSHQYHSPLNRPFSWHSETFMLPSSLPTAGAQESY